MSPRRRVRAFSVLLAGSLLLGTFTLPQVGALSQKVKDRRDTPGNLDVKAALAFSEADSDVLTHVVKTRGKWKPRDLRKRGVFVLVLDKKLKRCVVAFFARRRLQGVVTNCRRKVIAGADVRQIGRKTLVLSFSKSALIKPDANYRWRLLTVWNDEGRCAKGCFDLVPQRRFATHDHIWPTATSLTAPDPSTSQSGGLKVNVGFTASDVATLRSRPVGGTWTDLAQGSGSAFDVTLQEGVDHELQIVARDAAGNTTEGPIVRTLVPFDDDWPGIQYSGAWTTKSPPLGCWSFPGDPPTDYTHCEHFLGSRHETTDPDAEAVVTFTGTGVSWIGSRTHDGVATVILDGVPQPTIDLSTLSETRRLTIWESAPLPPGVHTLVIQADGGTVPVDAIGVKTR